MATFDCAGLDEFVSAIRTHFCISAAIHIEGASHLIADLGFDSLHLLEIVALFADADEDLDLSGIRSDPTISEIYSRLSRPRPDARTVRDSSPFVGRFVRISPVRLADAPFLYSLATADDVVTAWRYRGNPPTEQDFINTLGSSAFAQFVVHAHSEGAPVGWVSAYDYRKTCVSLSIVAPTRLNRMIALEGLLLLARHLFTNWDLDHLLLECWDSNFLRFKSVSRWLGTPTLTLREHGFFGGCFHDHLTFFVSREAVHSMAFDLGLL